MPGDFFNDANTQDGGSAWTRANERTGFFARNDATTPAPEHSVGGNGLFGLSTVPNASGVFGANNNGGTGVAGFSERGDGVRGITRSGARTGSFREE